MRAPPQAEAGHNIPITARTTPPAASATRSFRVTSPSRAPGSMPCFYASPNNPAAFSQNTLRFTASASAGSPATAFNASRNAAIT